MGLKADKPYPSLTGITENCQVLRLISPAYAGRKGELTATLQYVYQSIYLGECGKEKLSRLLLDIAVTEMHHIQILGALITRLGAPPLFTSCPPYPEGFYSASCVNYAKSPEAILSADIRGEREAISEYKRLLYCLNDEKIGAVISRIIEDEQVHLEALENAQRELLA